MVISRKTVCGIQKIISLQNTIEIIKKNKRIDELISIILCDTVAAIEHIRILNILFCSIQLCLFLTSANS